MHTAAKAALDGWTGPYTTMDGLGGVGGMCWPTVGLLDLLSLQIMFGNPRGVRLQGAPL